jgi:nitric oxide reductase activation protein
MIVFSDGEPAPSYTHNYLHEDVEHEVKKATKAGIKVIGIGLEYGELEEYYQNCVIVNDTSELPDKTIKVMKEMLKK